MTRSVPNLRLKFTKAAVIFLSRTGRAQALSRSPISLHLDPRRLQIDRSHITALNPIRPNGCPKASLKNPASSTPGILCL
jgi:hypothetical protein